MAAERATTSAEMVDLLDTATAATTLHARAQSVPGGLGMRENQSVTWQYLDGLLPWRP